MGITLATVGHILGIASAALSFITTAYNFIEEKFIKRKEWSKQNEEDKDQNKFQRDHRNEREIMNYYKRHNQKYNKKYDIRRDYDDDNFDYY